VTGRGTGVPPPDGRTHPAARPPAVVPADAAPRAAGPTSRPPRRSWRLAVAGAAVGYAWLAGAYPSFSWQSSAAVLAPGLLLLGYAGATGPRRPLRPARRLGRRAGLVWSVPLLGFSALEIVNDTLGSTWEHPTLSVLADPVLAGHPGRSAALLAWLAAGVALVRR